VYTRPTFKSQILIAPALPSRKMPEFRTRGPELLTTRLLRNSKPARARHNNLSYIGCLVRGPHAPTPTSPDPSALNSCYTLINWMTSANTSIVIQSSRDPSCFRACAKPHLHFLKTSS
jgi:hypothetical protein